MIALEPVTLEAGGVRLEPLTLEHVSALEAAAADGELWTLRYTSVPAPGETTGYVRAALEGQEAGHMLPWVVRELDTGSVIGSTRYHDIVTSIDRLEIGYTWYGRRWQGTHVNPACKRLLLAHAFERIGCAVVGLRTDILNARSQRAIAALGARRDGVLRHHQPRRDGSVRDTVMFSILADEWPDVRARLDHRLREGPSGSAERG